MHIRGPLRAILLAAAVGASCTAQPTRGPVAVDASPAQKPSPPAAAETRMPNRPDSAKFAVLGDFGTGSRGHLQMAAEMARVRERFPYEFVITVGDNIYGSERPQDFARIRDPL